MKLVTTRQVKAARALLGWSQADLAQHSGVSEPTVARLESVDGELGGREDTAEKIRTAIEIAGIEFIDENGGAAVVPFTKMARRRADLKSRHALLNMPPHPSYRRRQVRPGSGFMPGLANRLAIVR